MDDTRERGGGLEGMYPLNFDVQVLKKSCLVFNMPMQTEQNFDFFLKTNSTYSEMSLRDPFINFLIYLQLLQGLKVTMMQRYK